MNDEISDAEIAAMAVADAHRGDVDAQASLSINYTHGWEGFDEDPLLALHWLRRAAAQKHPDAQFNLAFLHDVGGAGVHRDLVEAQRLYALAAAQGHVEALTALVPMGTG